MTAFTSVKGSYGNESDPRYELRHIANESMLATFLNITKLSVGQLSINELRRSFFLRRLHVSHPRDGPK